MFLKIQVPTFKVAFFNPFLADDGGVCSHFVDGQPIGPGDFEDDAWDARSQTSHTNRAVETVAQSRNTGLVSGEG